MLESSKSRMPSSISLNLSGRYRGRESQEENKWERIRSRLSKTLATVSKKSIENFRVLRWVIRATNYLKSFP